MIDEGGGPAFPVMTEQEIMTERGYETQHWPEGGMSLRDYFAAQAITAVYLEHAGHEWTLKNIAERAYQLSDEMLKHRSQP